MSGSLLERRHSYEQIPRFFFPKVDADDQVPTRCNAFCHQRALERIHELTLSSAELERFTNAVCQYAYAPTLTTFQKVVMKKTAKPSGIGAIDRLLSKQMALLLSYDDWKAVIRSTKSTAIESMLPPQTYLMLPQDEDGKVNGYTILEYVYQLHRTLVATSFFLEQPEGSIEGCLTENELSAILNRGITTATKKEHLVDVDSEFEAYYELICTRMVVLRHDFTLTRGVVSMDELVSCPVFLEWLQLADTRLHNLFVHDTNRFRPDAIRQIHRQYLQLDTDKNEMLCVQEVMDFGKKKAFNPVDQTPTHDLTAAFVNHVFNEVKTFPPQNEMDYKGYIDFTLLMADRSSLASARFFWKVLDFQKQGFLDSTSVDFFLGDLVAKIHDHGEPSSDESPSAMLSRLRTQVFDLVAPRDPTRITWRDLTACKLPHLVVRMLTDYVAYRLYDECDGRFTVPS